jgi:Ca2+-binding RTX toxin-like protein
VRERTNAILGTTALAVALLLAGATAAMAVKVVGDSGSNDLTGTDRPDLIRAKGGDDTVHALAGPDLVILGAGNDAADGGAGCDRIFAGAGNDTIAGGPGAGWRFRCERLHGGPGNDTSTGGVGRDFMSGGRDDDTQSGGAGSDKLFANQGRDVSDGGDGPDVLWALSRKDVTAIGDTEGDELSGGGGADRFRVRDGEVDLVHCGDGFDRVLADQFDQVDGDCELVRRNDVTSLDQVEDQEENSTENPPEDG